LSTAPAAAADAAPLEREHWRMRYPALARFARNKVAVLSLFVIVLLFLVALAGPGVWRYGYAETVSDELIGDPQPPSAAHPLGTDLQGRDQLARILVGARISLSVGLVSCLINVFIGVTLGVIAGWVGGRIDTLVMRSVDVLYSVPLLLVVILLQVFVKPLLNRAFAGIDVPLLFSPDMLSIYLALGLTNWLMMARLARSEVIAQSRRDYVLAARAMGVPAHRILLRHVLPNCFGPLAVAATLAIPEAIFIESFLSFVGLGISAPAASWGTLADDGRAYISNDPHLLIAPAIAISITMLAFNLFGDGLRDALDPSQRR
jgi:oligopeptide transport system permease protein